MSSLGNFTAPSLSRLFTRKDHVQYTPGHRGDAAYLVNRFGARHGEILVPETWQGNFDGSDSVSDPVDWYQVDEFSMDFVVDRLTYTMASYPPFFPTISRWPFTLTYSSPGRTSIVQTGDACSYSGATYDIPTNTWNFADLIVGWPFPDWKLTPDLYQRGVIQGDSDSFPPTITPDPPTENWVARKGKYEVHVYYEWGGAMWPGGGTPVGPRHTGIITRTNRIIPVTSYQEIYSITQGGGSGHQDWTLPAMTANPLWNLFFKCDERVQGNEIGVVGPDRAMRFTVDFTRV